MWNGPRRGRRLVSSPRDPKLLAEASVLQLVAKLRVSPNNSLFDQSLEGESHCLHTASLIN